MEEKVFYESGNILVTSARFVSGNETFSMANIAAVRVDTESPSHTGPVITVLLGLITMSVSPIIGIVIAAIGAAVIYLRKPTHSITINTNGGNLTAMASDKKEDLTPIVKAIFDAIVSRG